MSRRRPPPRPDAAPKLARRTPCVSATSCSTPGEARVRARVAGRSTRFCRWQRPHQGGQIGTISIDRSTRSSTTARFASLHQSGRCSARSGPWHPHGGLSLMGGGQHLRRMADAAPRQEPPPHTMEDIMRFGRFEFGSIQIDGVAPRPRGCRSSRHPWAMASGGLRPHQASGGAPILFVKRRRREEPACDRARPD